MDSVAGGDTVDEFVSSKRGKTNKYNSILDHVEESIQKYWCLHYLVKSPCLVKKTYKQQEVRSGSVHLMKGLEEVVTFCYSKELLVRLESKTCRANKKN